MKGILALFALYVFVLSSAGCVTAVRLRNPFSIATNSRCPTDINIKLGDVLVCHPIYVSRDDIWGYGDRGLLTDVLERSGFRVLRERPESGSYLDVTVRQSYDSYMTRVTVEVRDGKGNLRYFGDAATLGYESRDLGIGLRNAMNKMCVVEPVPCP